MKITNTALNKKNNLVELGDGIFLRRLPMAELQHYFKDIEKDLDKDPEGTINNIFDNLVVDEKGNKFEDLVKGKATEILPLDTIMVIMEAVPKALVPDPKP